MTTPAESTPPQPPQPPSTTSSEAAGFMAGLFDFEFKSFIALRFLKVIYIVAMIFIGLGAVALFIYSLAARQFLGALAALVFMFFYLIVVRVWLEVIALLFRIGENTDAIKTSLATRN
jgi:hypothetical protein